MTQRQAAQRAGGALTLTNDEAYRVAVDVAGGRPSDVAQIAAVLERATHGADSLPRLPPAPDRHDVGDLPAS